MKHSLPNMNIIAEKQVKFSQLIVHGELFKYKAGGQMLALLELAQAQGGVDAASINRVLLGGGLYQVAATLLKSAVACELLAAGEGKYQLSEYGRASLREGRAWSALHTSVMAIGMFDALAPGQQDDHHLHLVARLDDNDHLDKFSPIEPGETRMPGAIKRFLQSLDARAKWTALAESQVSGSDGRSFEALLLKSDESRMFWNDMAALAKVKWLPPAKGKPAEWEVTSVETLNQAPTPLKKLLEGLAGHRLPDIGERQVVPILAKSGFNQRPDGSFTYIREDALDRGVIDVCKLTFVQRVASHGWSLKVEGRLAASSPDQALHWYFAKCFKADQIFTMDALRDDYGAYARRAGQPEAVTDAALRSAFYAFASSPNRAAHSRRGFFLHFPR